MDKKVLRFGLKFIKISSYLILIFTLLYFLYALISLFTGGYYSAGAVVYALLFNIILPVYGGILLYFLLYGFAAVLYDYFERKFGRDTEEEKESD